MPITNPTDFDSKEGTGFGSAAQADDDFVCVVHNFADYTLRGVRSSTKCGWNSECEIHTLQPKLTAEELLDLTQISERLRAAVIVIGKTQREIADEIGVSEQALSNWVKGIRSPQMNVARRLKRRYGITLDYLYDGDFAGLPMEMANLLRDAEGEIAVSLDKSREQNL